MFFSKQTLISLGFASLVAADSEAFGLLIIRSGAPLQNSAVGVKDGLFKVSSPSPSVTVTDDGKLKTESGEYAVVDPTTFKVTSGDESKASGCFAVQKGYLVYNGHGAFSFTEQDNQMVIKSGEDYTYSISAFGKTGKVPDFAPAKCSGSSGPSGANNSTISASGSSSFGNSTSTAVNTNSSSTAVTTDGTTAAAGNVAHSSATQSGSSSAAVQTNSNAANGMKGSVAVGAIAAVAALLF